MRCLLLACVVLAAGRASAADLPPDLALVPPSAVGFVHVRVADVWRSPLAAAYRKLLDKAGAAVLAKFDTQFAPRPSTLDRVTLVFLPPAVTHVDAGTAVIIRFTDAFDKAAVEKSAFAGWDRRNAGGKSLFVTRKDGQDDTAAYLAGEKTIVFGPAEGVTAFAALVPVGGPHPLAAALELAAGPAAMTAGVASQSIPGMAQAVANVPDPFRPAALADTVMMTATMGAEPELTLRAAYATDDAAAAALRAIKLAAAEGRKALAPARTQAEQKLAGPAGGVRPLAELPETLGMLFTLAGVNAADEWLDALPVVRDGSALTARVVVPAEFSQSAPALIAALLPAVQKVRDAAARTTSQNNLKQMALAMLNYHNLHGSFPPAAICDKAGKPLLSWRVAVLPFVEQDVLYKQFKLDEPWNSPANKKLIPLMPKLYADPRTLKPRPGETYYKVFTGKDAMFDIAKGRKISTITDGLSNTLMVVAGGDPVVWTKPDDIAFDPAQPLPKLFEPFSNLLAAFGDGSVRVIQPTIEPATLKALITAAGGELNPAD